jgi:protein ImuB
VRIAAVYLPSLRIELARARAIAGDERTAPMGIVNARPGGAVKDERSLLGGTRLDEVSSEARTWMVRKGDTIAAARAKCAELLVRVVLEREVRGALEVVAECGLLFGRTASIDESRDVVCLDVTGCGHLFESELRLARAFVERVKAMHHGDVRMCIADGPRLSSAIARSMRRESPVVVSPGKNAEAIRQLPIRALPIDEPSVAWMEKLGLTRVHDLQKLPMAGLSMRLGRARAEVAALLAGDDVAPLNPYVPPEVPSDHVELEYGIENTEALVFVAKMLCDRLALRLSGRAMAATSLEIELSLDRAVSPDRDTPVHALLVVTSPAPLVLPSELLAVVRVRIESWVVPAPVLAVTLRATALVRKDGRALDLFEPEAKADRALPRLVAELTADLGSDRVGTLALVDTWVSDERSAIAPFRMHAPLALTSLASNAPEPSRRVAPAACAVDTYLVRLLARVEAASWWRNGVRAHDYFAAWSESEARMAWVEIDRATGDRCVKGWMD